MPRLLAPLASLLATLALAVGCGGSEPVAAGGPGAAAIVPASVVGYVSLQTDGDAEQVERLRDLLEEFPAARTAIERSLREALDGSWKDDVEPALGDEVALAFLQGGEPVALTQPDDAAKLEALVRKLEDGQELEVRTIEGWHAVGKKSDLDAFERAREAGGGTLDESEEFETAFDGLEEDALMRAYGSGEALRRIAQGSVPAGGVGTVAFVAETLDDGIRFDGRTVGGEQQFQEFEPTLLDRVPDDSFFAASFANVDQMTSELRKGTIPFVPEFERMLGVTLDDLGRLLGGESVLYARSGIGIPELTLATRPDDPAAAFETLRKLATTLAGFTGGELRTTQVDGVEVQVLAIEPVQVQLARVDDAVLVTTGLAALRDFRADGDKLGDADRFTDAVEDAGFEGETAGLLYVDLQAALPVLEGLAGFSGSDLPAELRETLAQLDVLAAQTRAEDGGARFGGVLRTR